MKAKNSRFSLLLVLLLSSIIATSCFVGTASATTAYYSLDNWEVQSVWRGQTFDAVSNFTWTTQFGGVKLTNDTNDGKFAFALRDSSNTGLSFEIYVGAGAYGDYLSKDNTVYFKRLDSGSETLLYTSSDVMQVLCG